MRFDPGWCRVHEQASVECFNSILQAKILLLHAEYRFNAPALADWVSTKSSYMLGVPIGNEKGLKNLSQQTRPLNSWVLKDPVGMLPSFDEIKEETEWKNSVSQNVFNGKAEVWHVDEVHSSYINQACAEVLCFERLLIDWRNLGCILDQEQETISSKEERLHFRQAVKRQRINVLAAKEKIESYRKYAAPDFLVAQAAGASLHEKRLLDQMQIVLAHS